MLNQNILLAAFQKQFYHQWIDLILSGSPELSAFNRISHDKAIRTFSEKDIEQFGINKAKNSLQNICKASNT